MERQDPRSSVTTGASSEGFFESANPDGDAMANVMSAGKDTGKY